MKKTIGIIITVIIATTMLAGCGGKEPPTPIITGMSVLEETILRETIIVEMVIDETILFEEIITEQLVSSEYREQLDFNSRRNPR